MTPRPAHPLLKVCGATTMDDVRLLAAAGADYIGLWYGVPGGPADLTLEAVTALAAATREAGAEPVIVTFLSDVDALREVLDRSGVTHLQLHAFQTPATVRALRGAVPGGLTVIKVLHLRDGRCLEERFIGSYERAGTALFLLDKVTADGRVGSTGHRLSPAEVGALLPRLSVPFLLAGGITADRGEHALLAADPRFAGVDVDTAARDATGAFEPTLVSAIANAWHTAATLRLVE